MKLLIDMNLSPRWVDFLTNAGFEAKHWSKTGNKSTPDVGVTTYAANNDYVILAHDLDFNAAITATQLGKPSILLISAPDPDPDVIGSHVLAALRQGQADLEKGVLAAVDPTRRRMGLLHLPAEGA